jgi:uncharacterized protein YjbI with pentapeptide repeats
LAWKLLPIEPSTTDEIKTGETEMSIQKKSLIGNLAAAKKAIIATNSTMDAPKTFGSQTLGAKHLGGKNLGGKNLGGKNLGGKNLGGKNLGGKNLGGKNLGGKAI